MREGWEVLRFGDVLTHDVRRVPVEDGRDYPIVGVLGFGRGLLFRASVSAGTTSYRELNAIGPDQVVFSKLKAFEGAVTVTPPDLPESYASGEFPTFTISERAIPAFIRLLSQRSELWTAMATNSKGMGGRRERLSPLDFLTVRATFPPVSQQRRIVDLIGALDDAIATATDARSALSADRARSSGVEGALLRTLLSESGSPRFRVEQLGTATMGRQRAPKHAGGPHPMPYLRVANVADDRLKLGDVLTMNFSPPEQQRYALRVGDVLLSEGQSLELVGESVLLSEPLPQPMCFQNTLIRFRPDLTMIRPAYAQALFRAALQTGIFASIAKRTTTIAHLGAGRFSQLQLPVPQLSEQDRFLEVYEPVREASAAATREVALLEATRSCILSALLSGEHEIPESYDELMEVAS